MAGHPVPNPTAAAARIRAARAFAGIGQRDLADALHTSTTTIQRMESGARERVSLSELDAVADACGVPRAFMLDGFAGLEVDAAPAGELRELRERVADQEQATASLRAQVEAVAAAFAAYIAPETTTRPGGQPGRVIVGRKGVGKTTAAVRSDIG